MPLWRSISSLALLLLGFSLVCHAQDEKPFPTDDEIILLLTQTDRAIKQYKPLIDREEMALGKRGTEAVAKDRQVIQALEMAVKGFTANPQAFNGPLGFSFFEWLDDADRNAVLCASTASMESTTEMLAGNMSQATELVHLGQSCLDVSALLYTVSENAGSLYERYLSAEERLAGKGAKVAQECSDALKKMAAAKKQ